MLYVLLSWDTVADFSWRESCPWQKQQSTVRILQQSHWWHLCSTQLLRMLLANVAFERASHQSPDSGGSPERHWRGWRGLGCRTVSDYRYSGPTWIRLGFMQFLNKSWKCLLSKLYHIRVSYLSWRTPWWHVDKCCVVKFPLYLNTTYIPPSPSPERRCILDDVSSDHPKRDIHRTQNAANEMTSSSPSSSSLRQSETNHSRVPNTTNFQRQVFFPVTLKANQMFEECLGLWQKQPIV